MVEKVDDEWLKRFISMDKCGEVEMGERWRRECKLWKEESQKWKLEAEWWKGQCERMGKVVGVQSEEQDRVESSRVNRKAVVKKVFVY